jgi:hypothetical protein
MASTNINNFTGSLEVLLDGFSLGKMNSDVRSFLLNPANVPVIKQAIDYLGYSIPNNSSAPGIAKIKMLYFAAFYLKSFPLPVSGGSANCGQIKQTLAQLNFEQAQLKRNELDKLFDVYTEEETNLKQQVIADISTKFNALYSQYNCTAAQVSGGNNILVPVLAITGVLFAIVIVRKLFKSNTSVNPQIKTA